MPEKSSTSFEQQEEEEEEEEERPERNDVRKPHGSLCGAQSMAHRNQPINLGNLVISRKSSAFEMLKILTNIGPVYICIDQPPSF